MLALCQQLKAASAVATHFPTCIQTFGVSTDCISTIDTFVLILCANTIGMGPIYHRQFWKSFHGLLSPTGPVRTMTITISRNNPACGMTQFMDECITEPFWGIKNFRRKHDLSSPKITCTTCVRVFYPWDRTKCLVA